MDKDRVFDLPEEPKRAIKESVGVALHDPGPAIRREDVRDFIEATRLRVVAIDHDWHWSHDEHRQR